MLDLTMIVHVHVRWRRVLLRQNNKGSKSPGDESWKLGPPQAWWREWIQGCVSRAFRIHDSRL